MPTEDDVTDMAIVLMRDRRTDDARAAEKARAKRSARATQAYASNQFMQLLAGARKRGARTFIYAGNTYEHDPRRPWIYRRRWR